MSNSETDLVTNSAIDSATNLVTDSVTDLTTNSATNSAADSEISTQKHIDLFSTYFMVLKNYYTLHCEISFNGDLLLSIPTLVKVTGLTSK